MVFSEEGVIIEMEMFGEEGDMFSDEGIIISYEEMCGEEGDMFSDEEDVFV